MSNFSNDGFQYETENATNSQAIANSSDKKITPTTFSPNSGGGNLNQNANPNEGQNSTSITNNEAEKIPALSQNLPTPDKNASIPNTKFSDWQSRDEKGNRAKLYWLPANKCYVLARPEGQKFEYFYHYPSNETDISDAFAMPTNQPFQPKDAPIDIEPAYKMKAFAQLDAAQTQPTQATEKTVASSLPAKLRQVLDKPVQAANKQQMAKTLSKTNETLDKKLTMGLPKKAYVYSTRGEYLGEWTTSGEQGIFFVNEVLAQIFKETPDMLDTYSLSGMPIRFSLKSSCNFYIGENTTKELQNFWLKTKNEKPVRERGGLLYINDSKELRLDECEQCEGKEESISGDVFNWRNYDPQKIYLGSWHTHPPAGNNKEMVENIAPENKTYPQTAVPSGHWLINAMKPYAELGDVQAANGTINSSDSKGMHSSVNQISGGFGLIATQSGITIYRHSGPRIEPNNDYKPNKPSPEPRERHPFIPRESMPEVAADIPFQVYSWQSMGMKP